MGGEKVYPQEVENVLLGHPLVEDATVYGEKNPIIGNIVCARIKTKRENKKSNELSSLLKKVLRKKIRKI